MKVNFAKWSTYFLPKKKYFITVSKNSVKIETEIEKWNEYEKIVELSNLCRAPIAKNEKIVWKMYTEK